MRKITSQRHVRTTVVMKVMLKIRVRGQNRGLSVGTVEREGYEGVWSKVKVELRSLRSVRSKAVCGGIYK